MEELNNVDSKPAKSGKGLLVLVIILAVLVVGLLGYIAYGYFQEKNDSSKKVVSATVTQTIVPSVSPTVERVVDEGVTWLNPQKLEDLGLFAKSGDQNGNEYVGTKYYKVGTAPSGGDIILATVKTSSLGEWYDFHRFVKIADKYSWISKNSAILEGKTKSYTLLAQEKNITPDYSFTFKSILPDQKFTKGSTNMNYIDGVSGNPEFVDSTLGDKVGESKWGTIYLSEPSASPKALDDVKDSIKVGQYYIALNDSTKAAYEPAPVFLRDDSTLDLEFSTETQKADSFKYEKMRVSGCGLSFGSVPIAKDKTLDGQLLGKSSKGSKVYHLNDKNNPLVKFAYDFYANGGGDQSKQSIDEFVSNYGLIYWADDFGSQVLYVNQDFAPQAECGKPVVYLYPEKETSVEVMVGAKITKSDPLYKEKWTALASPSGQLLVDGKKYDSLFWEGLGYGAYPEITEGTIVKRDDVEGTIKTQLKFIGLNDKEISDFNEFWINKMPSSEYTRLTWFTNDQMNKLAPLKINPSPKSTIRVFLDFEGLDSIINLKKQQLPQYKREGFTVVEWGGLLVK